MHEILEYQKTIELVKTYVDEHPDTILISTSDHETGGLSLAREVMAFNPEYLWFPDVLTKVKSSTFYLASLMADTKNITRDFIVNTILKEHLGITDATDKEISKLLKPKIRADFYLADMISIRAHLGVTKHMKNEKAMK